MAPWVLGQPSPRVGGRSPPRPWAHVGPGFTLGTTAAAEHAVRRLAQLYAAERAALDELYNATGGPWWVLNGPNNWRTEPCHCNWTGVSCDTADDGAGCDERFVTRLVLQGANLTGTLPDGLSALSLFS